MRSIEDELTELVFEGLNEATALQLSQEVLGRSVVLPTPDEGIVEVEIPRLEIGVQAVLNDVHARVLRYGSGVYDLEINFIPRIAESASPVALREALHEFAIQLGKTHGVDSYYAGMDPASDEETRFFTGVERGPYF